VTEDIGHGVSLLAGRYQVGDLIGRGGMADVHVGVDSRLGRRVAIKLLKPTLATDPAFRTRFRREAQDAAKMAHPTIVRIFDAGEETIPGPNGQELQLPFIIMEFVDGRLLKDVVAEGPLEPNEAMRIIEQVLTALEYSHRAGLVHRDIKPGNIMITGSGQVKVMDFGIARAVSESSATIAQTSTIMGTAQYFSPEQARGESVDARTDLYSTGIMLFEMLTGKAPFVDENPVAVAYQHVNQPIAAPSNANPRVSPALDAVVLRAVAKDRFARFQSAVEFREAVSAARAGTVLPRREAASDDVNATLFGVNPSVTAGADATFRQLTASEDERVVRTQQRPPVAWIWGGVTVVVVVLAALLVWTLQIGQTASFGPDLAVTVPDVTNQAFEDGEVTLTQAKLVVERVDRSSDTVKPGTILETDPPAGTKVRPQQTITVYVSSGAQSLDVPIVVGAAQADAIALLTQAGFVVDEASITTGHSPNLAAGVVMSQTYNGNEISAANPQAPKGSAITLVVSDGQVEVPDVSGKPIGEATSLLAGLQLEVITQADLSCSGGTVSSQSLKGVSPQKSKITIGYCGATSG